MYIGLLRSIFMHTSSSKAVKRMEGSKAVKRVEARDRVRSERKNSELFLKGVGSAEVFDASRLRVVRGGCKKDRAQEFRAAGGGREWGVGGSLTLRGLGWSVEGA